jgi:hypothetical protein
MVDMPTSVSKFTGGPSSRRPIEGEDDLIVESSQSQLLIMVSPNVDLALDIVIPSSQSQENELTIPTEKDVTSGARSNSLV